jgi:CRP-like cAMP-binding protein
MDPLNELLREMRKVPWFKNFSAESLRKIAEISHLRTVRPEEVFFHEGDKQDYLYVVLEGRVALDMYVPSRGKVRFYTAENGDEFGWSSATPNIHQRTAGAVAVMDGKVLAIDSKKLRQLCEADHDLGYLIMNRLNILVASRLLVTRLQLMDIFAKPPEIMNA